MAMAMAQSFSFSFSPSTRSSLPPTRPSPASSSSSWSPPGHGRRRRDLTAASSLHVGPEDIVELARNKALIAATAASAVGQLAKPFTSGEKWGGFDLKVAVRSGGMPSTHSAAVVAVTTSIGLERGFSDAIFGMSVVFAAIVMYDAQGVRREVGNHARFVKKLWTLGEINMYQNPEESGLVNSASRAAEELVSVPEKAIPSQNSVASPYPRHSSGARSSRLNTIQISETELTEFIKMKEECNRLSESVGHTEQQVLVGALLGFFVTLAVYAAL